MSATIVPPGALIPTLQTSPMPRSNSPPWNIGHVRGKSFYLYEDETILWRFALPRAGWWRKTPRVRLPTRPLSQSHIKREESLKRQAWVQ
jgi:hypothetical protein